MDKLEFEDLLERLCQRLSKESRDSDEHHKPSKFEARVRTVMGELLVGTGQEAAPNVDQGFPDIVVGKFGAEVKATESNSWRCIANSVSEGQRSLAVEQIYVVFGKFGGIPEVRWASYGDSIMHVRTSHVPRFEIEIGTENSLFAQMGTSYEEFRQRPMHEKMPYIRDYARGRLKPGERLWWLEDTELDEAGHSLPLEVRSILQLSAEEKKSIRAEATLLVPKIFSPSRSRNKKGAYVDVAMFYMTYRGILAHQTRDFFSAGSVGENGATGDYVRDATNRIQDEMRAAALYLEDALFLEYWGYVPERSSVILDWLRLADEMASDWTPSDELFLAEQGKS
ncbi:hypothetical protein ABMC88_13255 [Sulfitobacter sp. HNIBRBA2951]|uniref:hypothetical protein n=1 Tax=Sulfitobacter aquimarinus TaxID=3158557 RepID=UPI0032DF820F